jgi:hypothetical protein
MFCSERALLGSGRTLVACVVSPGLAAGENGAVQGCAFGRFRLIPPEG